MTNVTYKYATVLVAIQNLRNEGYNVDFNLEENCLICGDNKYTIDDFEIEQVDEGQEGYFLAVPMAADHQNEYDEAESPHQAHF